jgi:hypothetical protein
MGDLLAGRADLPNGLEVRDRPPARAGLHLLYVSLAGKASVYLAQLGGAVEDPGVLPELHRVVRPTENWVTP